MGRRTVRDVVSISVHERHRDALVQKLTQLKTEVFPEVVAGRHVSCKSRQSATLANISRITRRVTHRPGFPGSCRCSLLPCPQRCRRRASSVPTRG